MSGLKKSGSLGSRKSDLSINRKSISILIPLSRPPPSRCPPSSQHKQMMFLVYKIGSHFLVKALWKLQTRHLSRPLLSHLHFYRSVLAFGSPLSLNSQRDKNTRPLWAKPGTSRTLCISSTPFPPNNPLCVASQLKLASVPNSPLPDFNRWHRQTKTKITWNNNGKI